MGSDRPVEQAPKPLPGYLKAGQYPNTYAVVPVPPTPKSRELAEAVDREAHLLTRKLKGKPRWDLATHDADESAAAVAADFDCALGLDLSPETAPKTLTLLTRVRTDAAYITTPTKERFQHLRPVRDLWRARSARPRSPPASPRAGAIPAGTRPWAGPTG